MQKGFTLIELSIVLVIIGLVIGGVLVGRDLVSAAAVRAQISQIEKYQTAVNTFRSKYGYLPGDISDPSATQLNFAPRGQNAGEGDANGILQGNVGNQAGFNFGFAAAGGETVVLWEDLTVAKMIDGAFNSVADETVQTSDNMPNIGKYFPTAKIGKNNFLYAWSGGWNWANSTNYFGLSQVTSIGAAQIVGAAPGLTVIEARNIDAKVDDGLPQSGRILALYLGPVPVWSAGGGLTGAAGAGNAPTTTATAWASTNCYDNNGVAGVQAYSVSRNSDLVNCALSFQFQ
jgi:prepilin-type N-terminal cleavage/methylation domain-containing protein